MSQNDVKISPLMQTLRDRLDAEGFKWYDLSEELRSPGLIVHGERTRILKGSVEVASCVYGYYQLDENTLPASYGYPEQIECWCLALDTSPVPATIDEIINAVKTCEEKSWNAA